MREWNAIRRIVTAIDFIEANLERRMTLETVADAAYCSKFHFHRQFSRFVGMTIHGYLQRRRLTEAAKSLVFSDTPIIHVALGAGYESQQAFTSAFTSMYKKSPDKFRRDAGFYPLQLPMKLDISSRSGRGGNNRLVASRARSEDIPSWINLVRMTIDGFPNLQEDEYLDTLKRHIERGHALIVKDGDACVGIALFSRSSGHIDFLGIHPSYRTEDAARAVFAKVLAALPRKNIDISITTYREGDRADTGHREMLKKLGFLGAELLTEYGYPTQKMTLAR